MRWAEYANPDEIRKAINVLQEPGEPFEVRILGTSDRDTLSGYFVDAEKVLEKFGTIKLEDRNVYITLGKVKRECFSRKQCERFLKSKQTTSDNDISGYRWLFVDLDPVRATGISSTKEELQLAEALAKKVYQYLKDLGFEEPVKALSGNGCHLLYRIQLQNTKENVGLVERCLKTLAMLFNTDQVKIDTTNSNPSRICKLHGTLAQKGANTPERPHRMSRIFFVPEELRPTEKVFLQKLASELPEEPKREQPRYRSNAQPEFDLIDFMQRNGLRYKEDSNDRAKIFKLEECPFDHNHKDGDAKIFQYHNGAIAFKCHHNSCHDYKWQDVRRLFEPDAYEREYGTDIDLGWQTHNRMKAQKEVPYTELTDDTEIFRTAKQIYEDPEPNYEYIRSGVTVIDQKMKGLQKAALSVISGTRGSGKTTLVGQIIVNAINDGHNVVCYSGELSNKKYLKWLIRQAAGKNHVMSKEGWATVPEDTERKIVDWMGERFRLYNNKFGNKFSEIEKYLRVKLSEYKADLCIIDNLMALDLSFYDRDKYDAQTAFVWSLKNLAELTNTHIIFVAHPKKVNGFIRLNDISGSGNIGNIVDNAFMVHRHNRDFDNGFQETFKVDPDKSGITSEVTNIIEIAKDREFGLQDEFIPLYFEEATKRLRNSKDEFIRYGWEPEENPADGFQKIDDREIPF